jgi:hypothetical protein
LLAVAWQTALMPARADTHTWTDAAVGNSNWNDGGNWSPVGPPASLDSVIIPTPTGGAGPAEIINFDAAVADATVGANGTTPQIRIHAGRDLTINAGDLINNGLIVVNSNAGTTAARLRFSAFAGDFANTLSGAGTVLLQAGAQTFPTAVAPAAIDTISSILTQAAGHTIRGIGRINANMVNNGEIWADDYAAAPGGNTLELTTNGMTNNGTIGATAGGTLDVVGTYSITQGAAGAIAAADDGATVQFRNLVFVTGGTLETKGTGIIVTFAGGTTRLNGVVNEGNYRVNNNGFTFIDGAGFTNNGFVDLRDSMNFLTSGTLDGDGEIVLVGAGSIETQTGITFNHAAGHTIRGDGQVTAALVNEGLIEATGTLQVTFNPMTNNHILRAASGGTLEVGKHVTQDPATGIIVAADGGVVKLTGSAIVTDGRLQSFGAGVFHAGDNTQLTDVHNQATIELRADLSVARAIVGGSGLTNDGAIIVNPTMQPGGTHQLAFCCDPQMTLDGAGYIELNHTNASLSVPNGLTLTNSAGHTIKGPGIIQGDGELVNEGLVWGGTVAGAVDIIRVASRLSGTGNLQDVQFSGTHAPGINGPGSVTANGQYEIVTGGRLEIEVGGTTSGTDFDAIHAHNLLLGGTLDVELINSFAPSAGQVFPFLTYTGGIFGSFATELLPALPGGLFFDVAYNTGVISLQVEGVLGDYNRSGTVDAGDYIIWRKTFGQTGTGLMADGDRSGAIDAGDYDVWLANFGEVATSIPGGSPQAAIPEPETLLLAAVSLIATTRYRVRHRYAYA